MHKGWRGIKLAVTLLSMMTALSRAGCETSPGIQNVTKEQLQLAYTSEEKQMLNAYQEKQTGLIFTAYENDSSTTASVNSVASDVGDLKNLPENMYSSVGRVKYEGFICFEKNGKQQLKIDGVDANIIIAYGELRNETYKDEMEFTAGTYYGIVVEFSLKNVTADTEISFSASSEYRLSQTRPTFGGVNNPTEVEPILDEHLRDAFILNGPDEYYYMTGTYLVKNNNWKNTNELHIYRSADLKEWTDLGCVWSIENDGTWQEAVLGEGNRPVWAPELAYINGTYYIIYSLGWGSMSSSILKSTTGKIEGPYVDVSDKPMFDYIDGSLFVDDDGTVYGLYSDGRIARMDENMQSIEKPRLLSCESGCSVGFEGCSILKYNGMYILTSAVYNTHINEDGTTYTTYDSMYAVSDNIYGPYGERRLMMEYGGHNNLFVADDGKIYTTCFYGKSFSERPGIVEISISDNGIITSPYQLTESIHIEDKTFNATVKGDGNSDTVYVIKLRSRSAVTVLINGKEAFESKASGGNYYSYEIDASLLNTDGTPDEISYSKERNLNIDAYFEVWTRTK